MTTPAVVDVPGSSTQIFRLPLDPIVQAVLSKLEPPDPPNLEQLGPGMVQHVRPDGSNLNDGWSWEKAKALLGTDADGNPGAATAFPNRGGNHPMHKRETGYVNLAPGYYLERQSIQNNAHLSIIGYGTDDIVGTIIRANFSGHLFEPQGFDQGWAHGLNFYNVRLDGRLQDPADGAFDLVRVKRGGFGCVFKKVHLDRATGCGINVMENAVNFLGFNLMGANCRGPAVKLHMAPGNNTCAFHLFSCQFDNCGTNDSGLIHIIDESSGDCNNVMIIGLETEMAPRSEFNWVRNNRHVIRYDSDFVTSHNPIWFTIMGVSAWNSGERDPDTNELIPESQGQNVFYDPHGRAKGLFVNLHGSGYKKGVKGGGIKGHPYESLDHHLIVGIRGRGTVWEEW